MEYLTRKDELMILSILKLGDEASLVKIREHLNQHTNKNWSVGNVFVSLEKLENKGFIQNKLGTPSKKRGGKAVKHYYVSKGGMKILRETKLMHDGLWEGLDDVVFGG